MDGLKDERLHTDTWLIHYKQFLIVRISEKNEAIIRCLFAVVQSTGRDPGFLKQVNRPVLWKLYNYNTASIIQVCSYTYTNNIIYIVSIRIQHVFCGLSISIVQLYNCVICWSTTILSCLLINVCLSSRV